MPASSSPGDRLRMEEALGPDNLHSLAAQCRALGIPLDRWHIVPGVASTWETLAVARLADRLQADTGCARKPAEEDAAARLGLNPDTIRSRFRRWYLDAFHRAA
jgi:hypothetical protein